MTVIGVGKETESAELVKRIIAGDLHAEEELIRRYRDGVSIIIMQIVRDSPLAEDLSQETFMKALEKIRQGDVREPEKLSGFICGMAKYIAIDCVRRIRRSSNQKETGEAEQVPDPAPDQLEQLCRKERNEIIRRVIYDLKIERDREVIFRYYIAEEDKDMICADLGLNREQFNRVIFRALKRYKELYIKLIVKP